MMNNNLHISESLISIKERELLLCQKGCLLWFTGLSGSGKSTIAKEVERELFSRKNLSYILDGDNIRSGLNSDLGFSNGDRKENLRRIGEVAKLFVDAGLITITAFISPFRETRNEIRNLLKDRFIEVYINAGLSVCEERDPKGLYKKARNGEIPDFTGISSPYEAPENPELEINTDTVSVEDSVKKIINFLINKDVINEK